MVERLIYLLGLFDLKVSDKHSYQLCFKNTGLVHYAHPNLHDLINLAFDQEISYNELNDDDDDDDLPF